MDSDDDVATVVLRNIPKSLHSKDLRDFFSDFVETNKFYCFHFMHRTETKFNGTSGINLSPPVSSEMCCCIIKLFAKYLPEFRKKYVGKPWGSGLSKCVILPFSHCINEESSPSEINLNILQEMHPPPVMPNGNVGTPTSVFLEEIRQCKLPTSLIAKLNLRFPKSKGRKYANVPYTYESSADHQDESDSVEDDDSCEEFERHEATTDDPSNQERLAERMYEEPLEVVWEKGGSGLVFYTDAQYWDEMAGDFDHKTADDFDVDMSVYYEGWEAGDMDARQRIEMAESDRLAAGMLKPNQLDPPPLRCRKARSYRRHRSRSPVNCNKAVDGFGKSMLEACGWKPGQGLGRNNQGISEPIEADGQHPRERIGFGYRGAKLNIKEAVAVAKKAAEARRQPNLIATVFDKPSDKKDPGIFRRHDHYQLRFRKDPSLPSSSAKPSGSLGLSSTDYR